MTPPATSQPPGGQASTTSPAPEGPSPRPAAKGRDADASPSGHCESPRGLEAIFRPLKSGNTFEETVERLAQSIKLGLVPTGERLPPERDLAERLKVSRVTLREAIKALQQAGYVESRRGRQGGTFVVYQQPDVDSLEPTQVAQRMGSHLHDALDFRAVVEPGAAALAASRQLAPDERTYLADRLDASRDAEPNGLRVADSRLHLAIAELSGSPSLAAAVTDVQGRLNDLLAAIPVLQRNIEHSAQQHAAAVRAIVTGNPRRATRIMEEHVAATAALLRGFLA